MYQEFDGSFVGLQERSILPLMMFKKKKNLSNLIHMFSSKKIKIYEFSKLPPIPFYS